MPKSRANLLAWTPASVLLAVFLWALKARSNELPDTIPTIEREHARDRVVLSSTPAARESENPLIAASAAHVTMRAPSDRAPNGAIGRPSAKVSAQRARGPRRGGSLTAPHAKDDGALILLQASRALSRDPARALELTRHHAQHYAMSPLGEERQALEIQALVRVGRESAARHALASFRVNHPRSAYRERLEALLGQGEDREPRATVR